jgi:SNF2 family DNA or RNA helicase
MFVTADTNHIIIPWREDLARVIPHARELAYQGQRMLVLPNRHEEAKVARNLGVPVPAPVLTKYDWLGGNPPPWKIQKLTAALITESPRAYVLNELGTGKTRAAIYAIDYLQRYQGMGRALIAAPLSTLNMVWEKDLFKLIPMARVRVLHSSRKQRLKLLAEDAEWYVINHHGLAMLSDDLVARGFDIIVIDELAVFRNKSSTLWKSANLIIQGTKAKYVWGMTGAPRPTAPTDAWAQIRLLTPERTTKTLMRFKDQTMRQVSNFKWIAKDEANDIILNAMQPSVRFTRDDVMELPPTSWSTREIKLDPEAQRAYKMLFEKMAMLTNRGETITAVNEGVLQLKLLQVACGYIYTDKREVYALPNKERLEALLEVIEENDRKTIVFVPFLHALSGIAEFLAKHKISVKTICGATPRRQRDKTFNSFQDEEHPRALVAHPECMAHGLTLTVANTIVWYCPINRLDIYEQGNGRIVRPSQTSKTLIVHLSGTPVEKATYKRLRERAQMQGMLLELFKNQDVEY